MAAWVCALTAATDEGGEPWSLADLLLTLDIVPTRHLDPIDMGLCGRVRDAVGLPRWLLAQQHTIEAPLGEQRLVPLETRRLRVYRRRLAQRLAQGTIQRSSAPLLARFGGEARFQRLRRAALELGVRATRECTAQARGGRRIESDPPGGATTVA